jgi:hypothetical protein
MEDITEEGGIKGMKRYKEKVGENEQIKTKKRQEVIKK